MPLRIFLTWLIGLPFAIGILYSIWRDLHKNSTKLGAILIAILGGILWPITAFGLIIYVIVSEV